MRYLLVFFTLFAICGCKKKQLLEADYSWQIGSQIGGPSPSGYSVNPKLEDGASILRAVRRCLPQHKYIRISHFHRGHDDSFDYIVLFFGRDDTSGFHPIYYQYAILAKKESDSDWTTARVFLSRDNIVGGFNGPIQKLEAMATEMSIPNRQPSDPKL